MKEKRNYRQKRLSPLQKLNVIITQVFSNGWYFKCMNRNLVYFSFSHFVVLPFFVHVCFALHSYINPFAILFLYSVFSIQRPLLNAFNNLKLFKQTQSIYLLSTAVFSKHSLHIFFCFFLHLSKIFGYHQTNAFVYVCWVNINDVIFHISGGWVRHAQRIVFRNNVSLHICHLKAASREPIIIWIHKI